MTQEEKELLLKDLCARLPYGVKVECKWKTPAPNGTYGMVCTLDSFLLDQIYNVDDVDVPFDEFKPYLFPLSSMTVEHICKVQNLLPNNCNISFKNQKITFYDEGNIQLEQLEKVFNFFNLYHFDYRGLIPKGLAIDATNKNIY